MDIFKLFFHHDLRLNQLTERHKKVEDEASLEDFLSPTPTYSKFHLTGTRLSKEQFGLSVLTCYRDILQKLESLFEAYNLTSTTKPQTPLSAQLKEIEPGSAIIATKEAEPSIDPDALSFGDLDDSSSQWANLKKALKNGNVIIYKQQAPDGFDLQIYSRENIYETLFHHFKQMLSKDFRFFSINSKRIHSEKQFFFETWALENPPHGAEEVLPDTVLRS